MSRRAERERWREAVEQDLMDRWKIIEAQQRRVLLSWRIEPCPDGSCEACEHTGLLPVALVGPPAECPHEWIVGKPKNGDPAFDWPFVRECLRLEQHG